jgi:hypothetical protein
MEDAYYVDCRIEGGAWTNVATLAADANSYTYFAYAVAVKSDSSLRRQAYAQSYLQRTRPPLESIGTRADWLATKIYGNAVYALAKDGTLWFGEESVRPDRSPPLVRAPRSTSLLSHTRDDLHSLPFISTHL